VRLEYLHRDKVILIHAPNGVTDIGAYCDVRTIANGRRRVDQVVYAMTGNPNEKIPYMPQLFPAGEHRVFWPQERSSKYLRPIYIPTNAKQLCRVWALDAAGNYAMEGAGQVMDHGYGIHYSEIETTWGCIRVDSVNGINIIADYVENALYDKEEVYINARY